MNNISPFFSIIITAYNIEDYISDCIRSVKEQSFSDFECIIVDDGSSDSTVEKINDGIAGDSRFELVKAPHGGQQRANNEGLRRAHGKYMLFPDGDDTLDKDCLKECAANAKDCDLLIFGINYLGYENRELKSCHKVSPEENEFESGSELADWYIEHRKLLLYSNANKCYKRDALISGNIRFNEELSFGDDRAMNFDFLQVCKKIKVLHGAYYNYRKINDVSRSSVFRPHFIDNLMLLHKMKMDCILGLSRKTDEIKKEAFCKYDICRTVEQALEHIADHKSVLSAYQTEEELNYLRSYRMPDYFYTHKEYPQTNLTDYITDAVFGQSEETDLPSVNTVIVLGSNRCRYRIEYAFEKYGGSVGYVCCGGNVCAYTDSDNKPQTEAKYMRSFLNDCGIKEVKIDNFSKNTAENIAFAASMTGSQDSAAVITGAFHAKRVEQIIKEHNLKWKVVKAYGPHTKPDNWFTESIGIKVIMEEFEKLM